MIRQKFLRKGRLVGRGSFASVYRGRLALSRDTIVRVAIKEPLADSEKLVWTEHEAWVLHELAGEAGVPRLYGVTDTSPPALVMTFCRGAMLQDVCAGEEAVLPLRALVSLCGVVRRLHARGVTHGDIHAANVMVDVTEGRVEATLLDFGLAELHTDAVRQMDDVYEVASAALQALPGSRDLSDVRWALQGTADLDAVEDLLRQALRTLGDDE